MGISKINGQTLPIHTSAVASLTPTVSISSQDPVFGIVTLTITNHNNYTNPNYFAQSTLSSDASETKVEDDDMDHVLESDLSHLGNTISFMDTASDTAERTVKVKAQEMNLFSKQSANNAESLTYTPSYITKPYIRFRSTDGDGVNSLNTFSISAINFYTGTAQSGTVYPTTDLTAADSETGIVVSAGHTHSDTYDVWKAADNSPTGSQWWSLSVTDASLNYWQIEFEEGTYDPAPTIKSLDIRIGGSTTLTHIEISGANSSDFSDEVVFGVYEMSTHLTVINFG